MNEQTETINCDELVEQIDSKYGMWDLYRAALGQWIVSLTLSDGSRRQVEGDTISEALRDAAAFKPLPLVPTRPRRYFESDFSTVRDKNEYALHIDGQFFQRYKTKRECSLLTSSLIDRSQAAETQWLEKHGKLVADGEPGVDFEWER